MKKKDLIRKAAITQTTIEILRVIGGMFLGLIPTIISVYFYGDEGIPIGFGITWALIALTGILVLIHNKYVENVQRLSKESKK
jgi:hypothetical protein